MGGLGRGICWMRGHVLAQYTLWIYILPTKYFREVVSSTLAFASMLNFGGSKIQFY